MLTLPQAPASPKACQRCDRVEIAQNFRKVSMFRLVLGIPLIYIPIVLLMPFMILSSLLVYWHLRMIGAQKLKTFWDFLPDSQSHRYSLKSQIVFTDNPPPFFWVRLRLYWIFNCTFYCPWSVALLEWLTYMTKMVEIWWCPFHHARKEHYAGSEIDGSLWHAYPDQCAKLHPDDRDNPLWNEHTPAASDAPPGQGTLPPPSC